MKSILKQNFGLVVLIMSLGISVYVHKNNTLCKKILELHINELRFIAFHNYRDLIEFGEHKLQEKPEALNQWENLIRELDGVDQNPYDKAIRKRIERFADSLDVSISPYQSNASAINSIVRSHKSQCAEGAIKRDLRLLIENLDVIDSSRIKLKFKLIHDLKYNSELHVWKDSTELSKDEIKCYYGDVNRLVFKLLNPLTGDVLTFRKRWDD